MKKLFLIAAVILVLAAGIVTAFLIGSRPDLDTPLEEQLQPQEPAAQPEPKPEPEPEPIPEPEPEPTPEPEQESEKVTLSYTSSSAPLITEIAYPAAEQVTVYASRNRGYQDVVMTDDKLSSQRWLNAGETVYFTAANPEQPFRALYLRWELLPGEYELCWEGGSMACGTNGFLHEYVALPEDVTEAWITVPNTTAFILADVSAFTFGAPPEDVQVWSAPDGKCDILAIPTHADDELLFFGPLLAYYIRERGLDVQIVYFTHHWYQSPRPHELLNGLWTLGVRDYPIISEWADVRASNLYDAQTKYDTEAGIEWQVELIRRFEPNIIIAHDINGEYGHGVHILNTFCLRQAVELAADPNSYPETAALYGAWDTPKMYIHLYEENQVVIPVHEPMENFGGLSAYEVASAAYDCHPSQHQWYPRIICEEHPRYDATLFGLYRSTVGADEGWDIMQNIPAYQ